MEKYPTTHCLKIKPHYYDRIASGDKTSEVRFNDRDFQTGDLIQFQYDGENDYYCDTSTYLITHVLHFPEGLKDGYVVLSIRKMGHDVDEIQHNLKPQEIQ